MLRRGTSGRSCSELHALRRRQVVPYEVSLASGHSLSGTAQHLKAQRRIVRKSGTGSLGRRLDGFDDAAQSGRPVRSPLKLPGAWLDWPASYPMRLWT